MTVCRSSQYRIPADKLVQACFKVDSPLNGDICLKSYSKSLYYLSMRPCLTIIIYLRRPVTLRHLPSLSWSNTYHHFFTGFKNSLSLSLSLFTSSSCFESFHVPVNQKRYAQFLFCCSKKQQSINHNTNNSRKAK